MCPQTSNSSTERAISPVIGTVLFLAIVLLLVAIAGAYIFQLTDQQDPAPQARLTMEPVESSNDYRLIHISGDTIDGDRLVIRGISNSDTLAGTEFSAGDSVRVTPSEEDLRIVWEEQQQAPSSYTLTTFEVTLSSGSSSAPLPDSVVFTGTSGGILNITGDGGSTSTISTTADPAGLGPASDIDSDRTAEVPYVDSNGGVRLVETDDGSETLLADDSDISGDIIQRTETRLAVGTWGGSDQSVFFANKNEDALYRIAPGGSVVTVATPSNGASGVIGPADIDGDDDDELIFLNGSDTIRYLERDGTVTLLYDGAGQNSGSVGGGSIADYDGDGSEEVALVDGGNNIYIADASDYTYIDDDAVGGSEPLAEKAPVTAADVDDDGSPELVYVAQSDGNLNYLDNIDGSGDIIIRDLTESDGSEISGDSNTGVT